ncbi:MAG: TRAP transporter large permease subunit [Deltaproteobacteria bacterium]|nr:TRAP transporter large permease subunit [Deltaproteobacteria bacterium]
MLLSPDIEKWIVLILLIVVFGLILYRKIAIYYLSLIAAAILILLGIMHPKVAFLESISWDVLAIYFGYGMLAIALRDSQMPSFIASWILPKVKKEKYALLFLCTLSAVLSSFMANPVVVLMLAPLAIEMATRLRASLFLYLIALAISSNVVTTVSMVADPPALILAMATQMKFLDFYWFQGRIGLGTLSAVGVIAALLTLLFQFRNLNNTVDMKPEPVKMTHGALLIFFLSIVALASPPTSNYPGLVGLALGFASLILVKDKKEAIKEFDWASIFFLIGIFIVIASVNKVGLLKDFASWMTGMGLTQPLVVLTIVIWLSVLLSAFIDNVPYTILMIPTCTYLAQSIGVNPFLLYFGMLIGTGIGGNITPVGATANVLACGMLEKRGYKIRLGEYMKISIPFSCVAVLVAQILLVLLWM